MPEAESSARALDPRYAVYGEIASGGMASVQYGRLLGPRGFTRAVAIKRLHPHFAREPEFVTMFVDEARLSARLVHANIIHTLDVIETPGEVALVMEYVHGETLWSLLRLARSEQKPVPIPVGCSLMASVLHGLHAAHEARGDDGEPLHIVHRDVSPQNILIGTDGIPRLLDFGIAKALGRLRSTPRGEIKGKLGYISREQLRGERVDRRTDVYGASAVFWEVLTGRPLFDGPSEPAIVHRVLYDVVAAPSSLRPEVPVALDAIVLRGLSRDPDARFANARETALAIEREVGLASQSEVEAWLRELAGERLAERGRVLAALQDAPDPSVAAVGAPAPAMSTRRIERAPQRSPAVFEESAPTQVQLPAARPRRRVLVWVIAFASLGAAAAGAWAWQGARSESSSPHVLLDARREPSPASRTNLVEPAAIPEPELTPDPDTRSFVEPAAIPESELTPAAGIRSPQLQRGAGGPPAEPKRKRSAPSAARVSHPRPTRQRSGLEPPPPPASASESCALFYYIDGQGIRRPKPECL